MFYSVSYGRVCDPDSCKTCEEYGGVCRLVELVNLTPHAVVLHGVVTIPPSGQVARVQSREEVVSGDFPLPTIRRVWGEVEGLPEEKPGTIYIVSSLVLDRVRDRSDVVAPDTGPTAIRDEANRIKAVTRLVAASQAVPEFASACRGKVGWLDGQDPSCCGNCKA